MSKEMGAVSFVIAGMCAVSGLFGWQNWLPYVPLNIIVAIYFFLVFGNIMYGVKEWTGDYSE